MWTFFSNSIKANKQSIKLTYSVNLLSRLSSPRRNFSLPTHVRSFRFITRQQPMIICALGWRLVSYAPSLCVTCGSQFSSPRLELLNRFCWNDLTVTWCCSTVREVGQSETESSSLQGRWYRAWLEGISENILLINHQLQLVAEQG